MLSQASEEKESDSDDGDGIATKHSKGKEKAVLEVERVPIHYTQESGKMMAIILSRKAYHVNVCEESCTFREEARRMMVCCVM